MAATKGIPIAAFSGQNHDAHIQVKMAYLQDPANGANPIMERIQPLIQANIQEHSILKYQEQMNGVTEQLMGQMPPEQAQDPAVIEMIMGQAAQQVMNANMAMGQAQSPEQQLVSLEQAKVELQKQKLQSDTMVQAAEMELKNKQLELDENEQIIDILKTNATDNFKQEKSEKDRESKKELKVMELMTDIELSDKKLDVERERILKDLIEKMQKNDTALDTKGLDALVKMAIEQTKKETKDETSSTNEER
jgi:Zn-dependent metalloprotease